MFGVGVFAMGMYWFYYALNIFGEANPVISFLMSASFIASLALFFALLGYASFVLKRNTSHFQWFLIFPILWGVFEWFRSWFLSGIPWLLSGVTQVDSVFSGYLAILGVFGTGAMVMLLSVILLMPLFFKSNRQRVVIASLAVLLLVSSYGLKGRFWVEPYEQPISIALVQGNIEQSVKFKKGKLEKSLKNYTKLTEQYLDKDLVIWPETAIPSFIGNVKSWLSPHVAKYKENNVQVLTGIFTRDLAKTDWYYNSFIDLTDQNQQYDKVHLVPLGEYIPFRSLFSFVAKYIQIPMSDLQKGASNQPLMKIGSYNAGISICFEDAYSSLFKYKNSEPDLYINISNDAWFSDSSAPWQHLEIARSRTLEYQKPMLRVTNNGVSAIIDATGKIKVHSTQFVEQVITGDIMPTKGKTPFSWLQNYPLLIIALFLLGFLFYQSKYKEIKV